MDLLAADLDAVVADVAAAVGLAEGEAGIRDILAALLTAEPAAVREVSRLAELPGFGAYKAQITMALLGKQLGIRPEGWREAAGRFGEEGSHYSVADITDGASLAAVREHKKQAKAAAKAKA